MPVALQLDHVDDALDGSAVRDFGAAHARQKQHLG
jgi:hypothetical protein